MSVKALDINQCTWLHQQYPPPNCCLCNARAELELYKKALEPSRGKARGLLAGVWEALGPEYAICSASPGAIVEEVVQQRAALLKAAKEAIVELEFSGYGYVADNLRAAVAKAEGKQ